mgnify:CR=1
MQETGAALVLTHGPSFTGTSGVLEFRQIIVVGDVTVVRGFYLRHFSGGVKRRNGS